MKTIIRTSLLLAALALTACEDEKARNFFAAGGITPGVPTALGGGAYQIPVEFETAIVHSAQWIDSVDAEVAGSDILVTASFTSSGGTSGYPGHIEVNGVAPGRYTLKYEDPDGTLHPIGPVDLR